MSQGKGDAGPFPSPPPASSCGFRKPSPASLPPPSSVSLVTEEALVLLSKRPELQRHIHRGCPENSGESPFGQGLCLKNDALGRLVRHIPVTQEAPSQASAAFRNTCLPDGQLVCKSRNPELCLSPNHRCCSTSSAPSLSTSQISNREVSFVSSLSAT